MLSSLRKKCTPLCRVLSARRSLASFKPNSAYLNAFEESMNNRDKFWSEAAKGIDWFEPFSKVYDGSTSPLEKWFVGGVLNTCYNCLDRHIERGLGSSPAIIYDSPVTDIKRIISYDDLHDNVKKLSGVLSNLGVQKGDVVVIYMPMIPEAQAAMLACARLGAVHCVGKS